MPFIVQKRERFGDTEVDLIMGKNHKGALLVMTDRANLDTRIKKLKGKTSKEVRAAATPKYTPPIEVLINARREFWKILKIKKRSFLTSCALWLPFSKKDAAIML